ncbi:hypothetical protein AB0F71_29510 [Kitasatospora sp. NPDC028055]|uniref:hypothetical protein n=1 Tax=Kitasatospora sp. NPDC028055 TaxID=3155653 RepID=UPI0033C09404
MFDHLEILSARQHGLGDQARFLVNAEDLVAGSIGPWGRGLRLPVLFPGSRPSPLRASAWPRRVRLGEPDCTGGCCGYLSAVVQRIGDVVVWSAWELPTDAGRPPEFTFEAARYEAEVDRAEADPWWRVSG